MSTLLCLALAIYHEARGEPKQGQYAVAEVVLNRSDARNKTVCDVVREPYQFSWTKHKSNFNIPDNDSWDQAKSIASKSLQSKTNFTDGATFFNTKRVGVRFGKSKKVVIGNHIFY